MGTLVLEPKTPIAQLILIPRISSNNKAVKPYRGNQGFSSTDLYWAKVISVGKPMLTLHIQGVPFEGLVDTGADVSVIAQKNWPVTWPTQVTNIPIKGVGYASAPLQSSDYLHWRLPDGMTGTFQPFVLNIDLNLWGRDILTTMNLTLETKAVPIQKQTKLAMHLMKEMGYIEGKGLGKELQGNPEPYVPEPKRDHFGLGFS
ncbi:endogenous retrovirus group K member 7 Pro protein-like [Lynx rufus]|uniref:endogenous retrovirus group K member 7 Pro protein-like n=1 Tax=Lynx rufus TaxID=61384 RepID=UPI001F124594|nr:endogenous retrovirus group K member 7 Pro protein-like [Lynx rufus]